MRIWQVIILIVLQLNSLLINHVRGESPRELIQKEENYVRRLREAGLYEIVEGYLTRKLSVLRLADDLRTIYVIELGRTFADHATTVTGATQQLYWQQANEILAKELATHPENSQILMIKVEQACLQAVKVEYYSKMLDLVADPGKFEKQVSAEGTSTIILLTGLGKELADLIKTQSNSNLMMGIKLFQLQALELKTKYELARVHLNLANLQAENQVEFATQLIQAEKILKQLTAGWTDETQTQKAWVQLARLQRLKKDTRGFLVLKKALEPVAVPEIIRDQITAEEVQLYLQEGKLLEAESLARERLQVKQGERQPAGELIVWHLQALKTLAELAENKGNQTLAEDLRKQIQSRRERLSQRGEGYWIEWLKIRDQRQELKLQLVPELAQLVKQAELQYQTSEFKAAAATYYQLSQEALKLQKNTEACEWGYTALSILANQQLWEQVTKVAGELYPQIKESEKANEVHFLWLLAEQQLLPKPWQKSPAMEVHVSKLQEHLALYGNEKTASRVRLFLAMIGDQLGMNAIGVRRFYLQVDPLDTEYHTAIKLACQSLTKEAIQSVTQNPELLFSEWEKEFISVRNSFLEKSLSIQVVETHLELIKCEILCSRLPNDTMQEIDTRLIQIEQWLQNVQISAPKTNETNEAHQLIQTAGKLLITEAQSVKCLQLFAMRDFEKVKLQIPQLKGLRGELLLELIQSLECYAVRWGKERAIRFQVSQLVLLLINFMDQSENNLNTAQQEILSDLKIEALSQTGQYAQARKLLEEELAANPARSLLAEKLIFMYLENGSPQSLEEAAKLVKKLEAKEKAGTNNWLTYRLLLLETGIKQNKKEETNKLWQVTKVLYPQAGTDEQKKKLLELGDKLKK